MGNPNNNPNSAEAPAQRGDGQPYSPDEQAKLQRVERKIDKVADWTGRVGFASKAGVYGLTGGFLIAAALVGSKTEDMPGAMKAIASSWIGRIFLGILTVGIILYVLWRLFECVAGLRVGGSKRTRDRIWKRFIPLASAILYGIYAASNIATLATTSHGSQSNDWSVSMLRHTYGRVLFFIGGVVLCGLFVWQMYFSISGDFKDELKHRDAEEIRWVVYALGYVGIIGRAVLFLWLGVTLIRLVFTPSIRAGGIGGAIGEIKHNWAGIAALFIAGALLIVYAVYCIVCMRYRKFIDEGPKDLPPGGVAGLGKRAKDAVGDTAKDAAELPARAVDAATNV